MIPLRIAVKNFGAIPEADIDLRAVDLAAVVGPNGAGKSTLFTVAPLWALFGVSKNGLGPDAMVKTGESEARVELEFEHGGELYRVVRTRSSGGRGKSSLELMKLVTEGGRYAYEPLSGATIKETEEKIVKLLSLDADTLVATAMILQGKADEFTGRPAGQRKAILAQVLGLDIYDTLQELAKGRARDVSSRIETAKARLEVLDAAVADRGKLAEELVGIKAEAAITKQEIISHQTRVREATERIEQAQRDQQAFSEKKTLLEACRREIADLEEMGAPWTLRINAAKLLLEKRAEIEAGEKQYQEIRMLQERRAEIKARRTEIDEALAELYDERAGILEKKAEGESALRSYREQAANADQVRAAAERLPEAEQELEEARQKRQRVMAIEKDLDSVCERIRESGKQVEMLDKSECVNLAGALNKPCRFLKAATEAKAALPGLEAEAERLRQEVLAVGYDGEAMEKLGALIQELRPKAQLAGKMETLKAFMERQEKELKDLSDREPLLLSRIDDMEQKRASLGSGAGEAEDGLTPDIERFHVMYGQLQGAEGDLGNATMEKHRLEAKIVMRTEARDILERELAGMTDLGEDIDSFKGLKALAEQDLADTQEAFTRICVREGTVKEALARMDKAAQEAEQVRQEIEPAAKEMGLWTKLVKAFGRDGIPALIIENAVPELERTANDILGIMSGGRHSLRFETQRDLKSKAGVAETLDIIVADWQGERPYETFSGGEQLRINFAIRFALAELLARRAGSRVEWLTIDEGLGSQDKAHRDLVLDSIRSVADRFRKVLVITHIEEAQGVFPQQIAVRPNGEKVEVEVS